MRRIFLQLTAFILLFCFFAEGQTDNKPIKYGFDVINYKLNLDLYNCYTEPYSNIFAGTDEITFVAGSAIHSIALNASSNLITIDSAGLSAASFLHKADTLHINLNHTYHKGDTVTVKIFYHHKDGKDNGSFSAYNGYVFTDCEPEGAREWFPCNDKPSDKATVDITAKVPSNVLLGSNGSLEDSVRVKDTAWFRWVSHDPVATYLVVLASKTNYHLDVVYWHPNSHPADSIPVRLYYVNNEPSFPNAEQKIKEMMTFESSLFGDFPFEKNGFASANKYFLSEGMEDQTLTILCKDCWQEWLVFHELTHQWFGDMISPKSWADIFMNEGFASYGQVLWAEHTLGYAQSRDTLKENARYYISHNKGFPISDPEWAYHTPPFDTLFNGSITYDKAACVLDQLRYVLGDSLFFHTLKAYAANPQFRFKNVSVSDFKDFVNSYTGKNYTWFFDEWIFKPNHPVYKNVYSIKQNGSVWQLDFTFKQTQANPSFFKMPVELLVKFADGTDSLVHVMNDSNNQLFHFAFNKKVSLVKFDPYDRILLKEGGTSQGFTGSAEMPVQPAFSMLKNKNVFAGPFPAE